MTAETMAAMADVEVENHGTIFLFRPMTSTAREWFDIHLVAPWTQWFGGAVAVEHRFAREIAAGMMDDGLEVV